MGKAEKVMAEQNLEETYFLVRLVGANGHLLSLQEQKRLSKNEYHPMKQEEEGEYCIVEETQGTVGRDLYVLGVYKEPYQTYQLKSVSFQKINDFDSDGFLYDKERGVVFYGYIYGLYAVIRDDKYYSVITDEEIPTEVIEGVSKRETLDDFMDMAEDLEIIGKHKEVYLKVVDEVIHLLQEGTNNKRLAQKRYNEKLEQGKRAQKEVEQREQERRKKEWQQYMQTQKYKEQEIAIASKRNEVQQLIYQIRNNN